MKAGSFWPSPSSVATIPARAAATPLRTAADWPPLQGADWLEGGVGNDGLYGGRGTDTLFGGEGEDRLFGNMASDVLYGGAGNDLLYGGQGDDVLSGGAGDDVLSGDLGADRYVFGAGEGRDLVLGFSADQGDRLDLQGQSYTVATAADGSALLQLSGGGSVELAGWNAQQISNTMFA
ncbi:hypothetical protein [Methylobacterium hispanicum]|uniref:calcium-binding protein n=1 Tax=Methylobacterium hispanicum TaxID=270350 RepID=UPI002F2F4655